MSSGKTKYDPLEAAKLGTDKPPEPKPAPAPKVEPAAAAPAAEKPAFETPKAPAPAPLPPPPPAPAAKPRDRYTVMAERRVSVRGQICDFKKGRVIDSAGYDIAALRAQGLQLELIKE